MDERLGAIVRPSICLLKFYLYNIVLAENISPANITLTYMCAVFYFRLPTNSVASPLRSTSSCIHKSAALPPPPAPRQGELLSISAANTWMRAAVSRLPWPDILARYYSEYTFLHSFRLAKLLYIYIYLKSFHRIYIYIYTWDSLVLPILAQHKIMQLHFWHCFAPWKVSRIHLFIYLVINVLRDKAYFS